jgi:hypothetical protein
MPVAAAKSSGYRHSLELETLLDVPVELQKHRDPA